MALYYYPTFTEADAKLEVDFRKVKEIVYS